MHMVHLARSPASHGHGLLFHFQTAELAVEGAVESIAGISAIQQHRASSVSMAGHEFGGQKELREYRFPSCCRERQPR